MKAYLIPIVITILTLSVFAYSFPLGINSLESDELGTSLTTINGTDKIKDSRSVINDNFTALNNGKIEVSTTTLPNITSLPNLTTVGAISSGAWLGTTIAVQKGGTGRTSFATNGVLYGNGVSPVGLTAAGVDGQVLGVSSGVPTWQSVTIDQSLAYDWTGYNTFTSASIASSSVGTLSINGTPANNLVGGNNSSSLHYHQTPCSFGTFTRAKNVTGNEVISHGLGVSPTYISVTATGDLASADNFSSYGVATSTTGQRSVFSGSESVEPGNSSNHIIYAFEGTYTFSGSLSEITDTTFTINIDANSNSGMTANRNVMWTACK